jgi:hypothetical protein
MRFAPVLIALIAPPAFADACLDEVRGMYLDEGGVFDPTFEIRHEKVTVTRETDGTETPVVTARWQAADQVISQLPTGTYMLLWGQDFYQGASWDGPWTDTGSDNPYDAVEYARGMNESAAASLTGAECDGRVDVDGRELTRYRYHVRIEPGAGSWWESDVTLYVDPETNRLAIMEEHGLMESWAPEPKDSVKVTTVDYDVDFTIAAPEG